jgi:hypothetical protein
MAELFVLAGRDVGRSFTLEGDVDLGRSPDCGITLHDRSVSRVHARLVREGDAWLVVDAGSRNGVRVNGERVERRVLADHDEILLGELPLRFRGAAVAPEPPPPAAPAPAPPSAAPPAARPRPSLGDGVGPGAGAPRTVRPEDEIVLEEDIDLAETATRPRSAAAAARPPIEDLSPAELERLRLLRQSRSGGVFSGDLSQQPGWGRALVYALVLAAAAGLFYGMFRAVGYLRGTV